jgi:hypothetical protein
MDKVIHCDFQGYTLTELFKARDAFKMLDALDFMTRAMEETLEDIQAELDRREKASEL